MVQYPTAEKGVMGWQGGSGTDWSREIGPEMPGATGGGYRAGQSAGAHNAMQGSGGPALQPWAQPDMRNAISDEAVEAPLNMTEAYLGSLKAMLQRNRGNYIVATFLIGTQSTVSFEGLLYEVGNDFITIYQEGRQRYIVVDMYSLKYIEFYDTRGRAMCQAMMQESGSWQML